VYWGPPCTGLLAFCVTLFGKIDNNNNNNNNNNNPYPVF